MFAISRTLDVISEQRVDFGNHPVANLQEVRDRAVMGKNPASVAERMGVFNGMLSNRRPAHMRHDRVCVDPRRGR